MAAKKSNSENEVTINGRRYVAADSIPKRAPESRKGDGGVRIVILQRGWVVVGHYYEDGTQFRVENAAVVRVWGTTKGIGEIASGGPTSKTILDDCGIVRGHVGTIVATVDCDESKWASRV